MVGQCKVPGREGDAQGALRVAEVALGALLCFLPVKLDLHLPSGALVGLICPFALPHEAGDPCRTRGDPGSSAHLHSCLWASGCGSRDGAVGVSDSRSASPKRRSEDDSYDDEMLSAIEGLSSTR